MSGSDDYGDTTQSTEGAGRCGILSCSSPAIDAGICAEHAAARAASAYRTCEVCGLGGYPWGVLVPCVQTHRDGRTLCEKCMLAAGRRAS